MVRLWTAIGLQPNGRGRSHGSGHDSVVLESGVFFATYFLDCPR